MGFEFVEYDQLKKKILDSVRSLAKHYGHDAKELIESYEKGQSNPKKLATKYYNISPKRRTQIGFLLTALRCLDKSDPSTQKVSLNAVAFYVREIIEKSYDPGKSWANYLASYGTTVDNSNLYVLLSYSLDITENNFPSNQDLREMFFALKDLMISHLYLDPENLEKGYILLSKQEFSNKKIEDFNPEEVIIKVINRIAQLEAEFINEVKRGKTPTTVSSNPSAMFPTVDSPSNKKKQNPEKEGKDLLSSEMTQVEPINSL